MIMKKVSRIIISVLLIILMLVPSSVFVSAEDVTSTTPTKQTYGPYEYYNLQDGLYTKKTVEGPNADGTYDVGLEAYTSDVRYVLNDNNNQIIDIMCLVDRSNSMLSDNRMSQLKTALKKTLSSLINDYKFGSEIKANVSIWSFSNQCRVSAGSKRLDYTALNSSNYFSTGILSTSKIEDKIDGLYAHTIGGTNTGEAMERMVEVIGDRISKTSKDTTPHSQILLLFTDGAPSTGVQGFDEGDGEKFANKAISKADELKGMGVSIYSVGVGDKFSAIGKQTDKSLNYIINNSSWDKDLRRATLFLNIVSSGWRAKTVKSYDWQSNSASNSWTKIPDDYSRYINPKNPNSYYYFGGAKDANNLAQFVGESIIYNMATRVVSNGSLLGDYIIRDTVSSYFEIVPDSTAIYQVPYLAKKNSDGSWSNSYTIDAISSNQYGESNRKWAEESQQIDITSKLSYNETNDKVEILAPKDSGTVIDVCVVDDMVIKGKESHSGNKLRVTYKIRPKDSFMGAYSVATHDYNNSGIFKETVDSSNNTVYQAVQKFASLDNLKRVQNITPEVAVSLVNSRLNVSDDNVKIGMLYDINELASNYSIEYDGRYSGNTYSLKYNNGALRAYDSSNSLVTYKATSDGVEFYPTDFITLKTGGNVLGTGCENVVTDGTYIQFNSSGISLTDGTYSKTPPVIGKKMYIAWKTIDGASTLDDIINRFNAYNAAGQTDGSATANQGIVNNVYYRNGFARVQQLLGTDNVNVYVPMITVSDSVISSVSGVKWNVSSSSLESTLGSFNSQNYSADSTKYDDALNAIDNIQINYKADICQNSRGNKENRFVLLQPLSEDNTKVAVISDSTDATFINDVYKNNDKIVTTSAHMLKFADKDGNERSQNDNIAEGDKFKVVLTYDAMYNNILAKQGAPFKATVDEHYTTTGDCSICKAASTSFTPSFLGYDAQIHLVSNAITVKKQGCDENHLNESFVFSLIGIKENAEGTDKDMSTAKVLSNFTIQGNGTRTIPVDANEYQYFYVVEDTNAKENNGWTWDYSGVKLSGVKLNGSDYKGWAGMQTDAFELNPGDNVTLTFKNEYNADNENLHYASAYCSNILSNGKETTVTDSHSLTTNNTEG